MRSLFFETTFVPAPNTHTILSNEDDDDGNDVNADDDYYKDDTDGTKYKHRRACVPAMFERRAAP